MDVPLLECQAVSRSFGALKAVDRVSFRLDRGEVLGIGGPNGAGKTTLFDVITGITPPSGGRIAFAGHDITDAGMTAICHRGLARTFQLNAAFEHLTVSENIAVAAHFGRRSRRFPGFRTAAATRAAVREAIELVGLTGKEGAIAGSLPVLDRKLLMIASAVATAPSIILLDEPVGGLNVQEIDRVQAIIEDVRGRDITIVVIEHVMRFLLTLSTRVLIMHHGQIIFEGMPREVAEDPTVVETYLGTGAARRLQSHFGAAAG